MSRRFTPPWTTEDTGSSWVVKDATGAAMVWFCYSRDLVGTNPDRLSADEARRLARGFCRLPELLAASQ